MDSKIQPYVLVEIPLVVMDEKEPPLESDAYLESLMIEDLNDVDDNDMNDVDDNDTADVDGIVEVAGGSQMSLVVQCLIVFAFCISYLKIPLGKFWM